MNSGRLGTEAAATKEDKGQGASLLPPRLPTIIFSFENMDYLCKKLTFLSSTHLRAI